MFGKISVLDWSMLALSTISVLFAYLRGLGRLRASARKWLGNIGEPLIQKIVLEASTIADMSGSGRREYAAERLQELAWDKLGLDLPESVANYLVEHVYQGIKERIGR